MGRPIVLITQLFRLAGAINYRKDYSPSSSPPSQPYTRFNGVERIVSSPNQSDGGLDLSSRGLVA
jgi:hypothetical protein